jgi:hypothetical protein
MSKHKQIDIIIPFLPIFLPLPTTHIRHVAPSTRPTLLEGKHETQENETKYADFVVEQDLGKSSNDLLGKDFHYQGTSLEVKTKTPSNVTFKVAGSHSPKSDAIAADIEAKYTDAKHGFTFTETWTTSNILKSQVELENHIANGLKLDLTTTLLPEKNSKGAILNAIYKQSGLHTRAALDVFHVRSSRSYVSLLITTTRWNLGPDIHCRYRPWARRIPRWRRGLVQP